MLRPPVARYVPAQPLGGRPLREVVFDSDAIRVVKITGMRQSATPENAWREDVVFVTFESYADERVADRAGYGEHFLHTRGFTAYHFLPRSNAWYQYAEMADALASVRADLPPGKRILTYGMSMGGYAAFRFAEPLGAHGVIAFSPQYSIDPALIGWEQRWREDLPAVLWEPSPVRRDIPIYVFYDPNNGDRHHVRLMARHGDVRRVRLRHGGHPCAAFLNECGLLGETIIALAEDRFDPAACEREAWARRERSASYHEVLSRLKPATPMRNLRRYLIGRFG